MVEIVWQSWFELGNFRIDSEHRVFLDLIMGLNHDHGAGIAADKLARSLKEIHKYAEFHFLSEENMMIDVGYPQRETHAAEHAKILHVLEANMDKLIKGDDILDEFLTFLYDWFSEHTVGTDYHLTQYISAKSTR
ncbi:MAG: hemerythrin [Magnetospirillum sp.]|nr:MAG: hemerythrin [Magnetospirillum sp.]